MVNSTNDTPNHEWTVPVPGYDASSPSYAELINTMIDEMDVDVVMRGTEAEQPAPGTTDRIYIATDTPAIYHDDGDSWNTVAVEYTDEAARDAVAAALDGDGDLAISHDDGTDAISITFASDMATQAELSSHADSASAHHAKTTSQSDLEDFASDAATISVSSSAPSSPSTNDIWFDTS